jgi:hypothetical protein
LFSGSSTIITITIITTITFNLRSNGRYRSTRCVHAPVHLLMPGARLSSSVEGMRATICPMKRILATVLLFTLFATPSFGSKHPRQHRPHENYRYKAPKTYKVHIRKQKQKHRRSE